MIWSSINILQRFVIVVALITLLITIGVSVLGYRATLEQMEAQLQLQLQQDAENVSLDFKSILDNIEGSLSDFALNPLVANALVDDRGREIYTDRLFEGLRRVAGVQLTVSLVDFKGEVISGTPFSASQATILRPAISDAIEQNRYTLWGISSNETGDTLVFQAPIIFKNTGLPEGALIYRIGLQDLFDAVMKLEEGEHNFSFVRAFFLEFEDKRFGLLGELIKSDASILGQPEIKIPVALPIASSSLQMHVGLTSNRDLFRDGYQNLLNSKIIFGALTFILSIILAYPLGLLLLRRLTQMQIQASQMVQTGQFSERFHLGGSDEISLVAKAFNSVLNQLESAYQQMESTNERLLKEQSAKYQAVISQSTNAMLLWNSDGRIIEANHAALQLIGRSFNELQRMAPSDIVVNSVDSAAHDASSNLIKNSASELIVVDISTTPILMGDRLHYLWMVTDKREQLAAQELKEEQNRFFEKIAHTDPLTELPNRRMLNNQLHKSIAKAERDNGRLAICYIDLDGFKEINDSAGHKAGDQVLINVANRLCKVVRPSDTVARLGGDEFVLLLEGFKSDAQCLEILERVLKALREPHDIDGKNFIAGASIGVTLYPNDDDEPEIMLRHADQAMYQAKEKGRNQYHLFNKAKDSEAQNRHKILTDFALALEQEQLILEYQPTINMGTGKIVGAEALIRWQHPDQGLLMPGAFLRYLDGSAYTQALDWYVIPRAIDQLNQWIEKGLHLNLSVNVSASTLQSSDFIERLSTALLTYPLLPRKQLVLEILESDAIIDLAHAANVVKQCSNLGVQISLDDFGTGYSSLSYFRQLPVNELKIDSSFIRDILQDSNDLDLVRGIIGLAKTFGKNIVAEGVETIEQGVLLLRLGCEIAQGYAISRSMINSEFESFINSYRAPTSWLECGAAGAWEEEDVPVLLAESGHRHWINQLAHTLQDDTEKDAFELDEHQCRFGKWLEGPGYQRHQHSDSFQELTELHKEIHQLGHELLQQPTKDSDRASAQLTELSERHEKLIKVLHELQMQVQSAYQKDETIARRLNS